MTTTATMPAAPRPRAEIPAKTLRTDRWWLAPLLTFLGLTAWVAYATVRVFMQKWYFLEGPGFHSLTPFYSPCVSNHCDAQAAEFGRFLPANALIPFAAVSLPFLLLFRLTCYYYRRAYYPPPLFSPPAPPPPARAQRDTRQTPVPLIFPHPHRHPVHRAGLISLGND